MLGSLTEVLRHGTSENKYINSRNCHIVSEIQGSIFKKGKEKKDNDSNKIISTLRKTLKLDTVPKSSS